MVVLNAFLTAIQVTLAILEEVHVLIAIGRDAVDVKLAQHVVDVFFHRIIANVMLQHHHVFLIVSVGDADRN